jgi:SAM-dependent methyltransferase
MARTRMGSREFGLVLAQQILDIEDLHYGYWDDDLKLSPANLPAAQRRYNELLLGLLPQPAAGRRVLDVGCGTGHLLAQLLDRGYRAEGVSPAPALSELVLKRLRAKGGDGARLHQCKFEDFPAEENRGAFEAVIFSESYQYIPLERSIAQLAAIVKPDGIAVICDFFRSNADGGDGPGEGSFGGGHRLTEFYREVERAPFAIERDEDITRRMSPNIDLVNDVLMNRVKPATETIGAFLAGRYPLLALLGAFFIRRRWEKTKRKYLSGHRSRAVFELHKVYRLIVLRRTE